MDLILWRHAEAEDGTPTLPDGKRRLTARGEKQARGMAKWLQSRLPRKTRVLVSPTERTQQTAHALQMPYEIEPKVGAGATAAELLQAAGWPNQDRAVLIIGHQPSLGQLAGLVLTGSESALSVKKGGVWWLSCRVRDADEQTVLRAVMNPEFL
jgi:phosphohistidine phosphatase